MFLCIPWYWSSTLGVHLPARVYGPDTYTGGNSGGGRYFRLDCKAFGADIENIFLVNSLPTDPLWAPPREAPGDPFRGNPFREGSLGRFFIRNSMVFFYDSIFVKSSEG